MGRKRKDSGYNKGKFKEIEYFLKGLRAPIFKLINSKSKKLKRYFDIKGSTMHKKKKREKNKQMK